MGLATVCDFTLAVPEAKFGYTEVRIGFIPAIVASFLLRQVGEKRTRDLLLSGRIIKAPEAMELGLVTRIVAEQDLTTEAESLAQTLLKNSPESMTAVKRLLVCTRGNGWIARSQKRLSGMRGDDLRRTSRKALRRF